MIGHGVNQQVIGYDIGEVCFSLLVKPGHPVHSEHYQNRNPFHYLCC